jgi:hypothetical protein
MMVSGIPTASGFEERIRFSELEIVDANAIDTGVLSSLPEGNYLNGWDVNVAGVRIVSVKRKIRHHKHAVSFTPKAAEGINLANHLVKEFLLRVRRKNGAEQFVGRRYGDFAQLYKRLRTELPGRVLPPLPHKNKSNTTAPSVVASHSGNNSETSSLSSVSTQLPPNSPATNSFAHQSDAVMRLLTVKENRLGDRLSPRTSFDGRPVSPSLLSPKPQEVLSPDTGKRKLAI